MFKRAVLAACMLVAAQAHAEPSSASRDAAAGQALAAAIMARLQALPDRDAAFSETKQLTSLAAPLHSSGRLVFRHPSHLEKITTAPRPEQLIIDNGTLTIAAAGAATRQVALDAHPALQAMAIAIGATLAGDLRALQAVYDVNATGSIGAWHVILRPRQPGLARFVSTITLDGSGADLHDFTILQANGDSQALTIRPAA